MTVRQILAACGCAAAILATTSAWAEQCFSEMPSPHSSEPTKISVTNTTPSVVRVLWANPQGGLTEYARLSPNQEREFDTFIGHQWYLETQTRQGTQCVGPLTPSTSASCDLRAYLQDGQTFDAHATLCDR
ncbi:MAG TPA: hypothetical protein VK196_02870 [Magnetospirillum sp.]|nr:hypothetical protein [Magnetospirillum sp.]